MTKLNSFNICFEIYFEMTYMKTTFSGLVPLINMRIKKALNFQYSGQAGCLRPGTKALTLALRPIQPPIQWILGTLSPGVKDPGHEADLSTPTSSENKNEWTIPLLSHMPSWCVQR